MKVGVTQTGRGVVDEHFALTRTVEVEFHDLEWLTHVQKHCGCCLHTEPPMRRQVRALDERFCHSRYSYWVTPCRSCVTGMPACAVAAHRSRMRDRIARRCLRSRREPSYRT